MFAEPGLRRQTDDEKPTLRSLRSVRTRRTGKNQKELEWLACGQSREQQLQYLKLLLRDALRGQEKQLAEADGSRWESCLFTFVRFVKGDPALRGSSAGQAFDVCTQVLREIHAEGSGRHVTNPWVALIQDERMSRDLDDVEEHFSLAWDNALFPVGFNPLHAAVEGALRLRLPDLTKRGCHLLAICEQLASMNRENDRFFLPQAPIAKLLECDRSVVSQRLTALCRAGYLERLSSGSNLSGKASRYKLNRTFLEQQRHQDADFEGNGLQVARLS